MDPEKCKFFNEKCLVDEKMGTNSGFELYTFGWIFIYVWCWMERNIQLQSYRCILAKPRRQDSGDFCMKVGTGNTEAAYGIETQRKNRKTRIRLNFSVEIFFNILYFLWYCVSDINHTYPWFNKFTSTIQNQDYVWLPRKFNDLLRDHLSNLKVYQTKD